MSLYFEADKWGVSKGEQRAIELVVELERERKKQNLTQKEVAKRANITQGQLSRMERLENPPSLETLVGVAEALGKQVILK